MKKKFKELLERPMAKKLIYAIQFFTTKRVLDSASALTYSTLLSLVPLSAVVFAIARGFGYTIYIEQWFRGLLSSQPQIADFVIDFVDRYLEHTKSGIILGIGLVFMLYTVVMLTRSVEQVFNGIWHVEDRSNIMRTVTDYVAIFFLVPILVILISGISMFVTTLLSRTGIEQYLGPVMQVCIDVIPFLLMWCAFAALYVMMPNTKVKFRFTVVPAFLSALAMTILQWFFINVQMFIANYNAIYGSFAALPLFMLWLQFSWTICLFGAELCFTNQNIEEFKHANGISVASHRDRLMLSLVLLSKICRRFAAGEPPYSATKLYKETGIPLSIVRDLLIGMTKMNILSEINGQKGHSEVFYQPYVTLEKMTVGFVLEKMDLKGEGDFSTYVEANLAESDTWKKVVEIRKRSLGDLNGVQIVDI